MGTSVRSNPSAFARKWFFHGARKVSFTNSERKADGGGVVIVGTGVGRAFGGSQAPTQSRAGKSLTTLWRSREGPVRLAPRAYDKFPAGGGLRSVSQSGGVPG